MATGGLLDMINMGGGAAAGAGIGSVLGPVGTMIGGLSGAAANIAGIISSGAQRGENQAWKNFQRVKEPVATLAQQLYYNPAYQGYYEQGFREPTIVQQLDPGQTLQQKYGYQWSPTASTKQLYSGYLSRQYGLPETLARSMSSQALSPLKAQPFAQQAFTPAQARGLFGTDPQTLANVALQRQQPEALRQMDYLQNAGQLAAFNLYRTQQLPSMIG